MKALCTLPLSKVENTLVPRFFDASDIPWIQRLLGEYERFVGKPQSLLQKHLTTHPDCLCFHKGPGKKKNVMQKVLNQHFRTCVNAPIPPKLVRQHVFLLAAKQQGQHSQIFRKIASDLNLDPKEIEQSLFADLPSEQHVCAPRPMPSSAELVPKANLVLVQTLLRQASHIQLCLQGNARSVVRQIQLRGLMCVVSGYESGTCATLDISGPVSLFRHTRLYGNALASLVPQLAWCHRFQLRATIRENADNLHFCLSTGAPIFPSNTPRPFDSKLKERFAKEASKKLPDWDIIREPEPIQAGKSLIFPDVALANKTNPCRSWLVEIVGFWTDAYLEHKLNMLRKARIKNFIVCLDKKRNCGRDFEKPLQTKCVLFDKSIPIQEVAAIIDPPV